MTIMTRRSKPTVSVSAVLQVLLFSTIAPQTMVLVRAQNESHTGGQIFYSSLTTSEEPLTNCSLAVEACAEDAACAECVASISTDRFRSRRLYSDVETSSGESEVGKVIMIHLITRIVVYFISLPCKRRWPPIILSSPCHAPLPSLEAISTAFIFDGRLSFVWAVLFIVGRAPRKNCVLHGILFSLRVQRYLFACELVSPTVASLQTTVRRRHV